MSEQALAQPAVSDRAIETRSLIKRFGGLTAVNDVSVSVTAGSVTSLIGPNGAGKSTLFNMIAGLTRPDSGRIYLNGRETSRLPSHRVGAHGVARTFQQARVFPGMTVLENVLVACAQHPGHRIRNVLLRPRLVRRMEAEYRLAARSSLARVGLESKADQLAGELSGGQGKLLELAMVLMSEPVVILLDEPMAGVNPALGEELLDHLLHLNRTEHITIVFVEHDLDVVMRLSDEVIVMSEGAVLAVGTPAAILNNQAVLDAYLGGTVAAESSHDAGSGE